MGRCIVCHKTVPDDRFHCRDHGGCRVFVGDVAELLDTLKPRRYEAFTAPTIPNPESDKPVPCFVMTYAGDREVTVSLATFRAMKSGVEYLFGCGSNIVVKRHGDMLIARKLETFHELSELEG